MDPDSSTLHFRLRFSGDSDTATFEGHRTMGRLRAMNVFNRVPRWLAVYWDRRDHSELGKKEWVAKEGGNAVTLGEIFD
jgi:hypothetical protein